MRVGMKVLCGIGLPLLAATVALAQEGPVGSKPQLSLWADTHKFVIPGLENLPPEAKAALGDGAQRSLRVNYWTPGAAPASATANLDIPGGLKLGPTLPLELPKPGAKDPNNLDPSFFKQYENYEFRRLTTEEAQQWLCDHPNWQRPTGEGAVSMDGVDCGRP